MKTVNPYQPDNALQKAYDGLWGGCLCGHFESCSNCDGSMNAPRRAIEEAAEAIGYQLYIKSWNDIMPHPVAPLREREPWRFEMLEHPKHPSFHDTMKDEQSILKNMLED